MSGDLKSPFLLVGDCKSQLLEVQLPGDAP
jgi:hypothetical protein